MILPLCYRGGLPGLNATAGIASLWVILFTEGQYNVFSENIKGGSIKLYAFVNYRT
tara:strand:- start:1186 stop:1353 length:168 start_codon:yes stop_codon:yes gene_type:complete